ncbi:MAG TPA: long-chain fatty acid--CoA ligase [Candidatus Dormibacteraeota bacterium]
MKLSDISERTTVGVFLRQANRLADRTLVRTWTGDAWREVTWAEMRDLALRVAGHLVELGVRPRDRVILLSENRLEWLYCDLGIQAAGAVTVPIYPSTPAETARLIAADSEAVLAIASGEALAGHLEPAGDLKHVLRMDREVAEWVSGPYPDAEMEEIDRRLAALDPEQMVTIIYTSGTTGEPKGVMLAHRNFVDMAYSGLKVFPIGEQDVTLSFLPFAHVLERVSGVFTGMLAGGSSYLSRGIDRLVEDIAEARPTVMVAVPRVYEKMYERVQDEVRKAAPRRQRIFEWAVAVGKQHSRTGGARLRYAIAERLVLGRIRTLLTGGRLRFFVSGGAPLAREVEEFFWALGVQILQGWGLTETTSGATSNTVDAHKYGTVGRPLPGVEIKTAKDGEVMVKGPCVMLGYFKNERATEETIRDGWLSTGDIGEIDGEGFLTITDRKKDLIKTAGGKYVAPQPLEARLQEDPTIERAVVVGDQRPYCVALIVPNWDAVRSRLGISGEPSDLVEDERVRDHVQATVDSVNRGLGSWETIKYFRLLPHDFTEESGEVTPTLKVKRRVIMERHAEEIDALYAGSKKPERQAAH